MKLLHLAALASSAAAFAPSPAGRTSSAALHAASGPAGFEAALDAGKKFFSDLLGGFESPAAPPSSPAAPVVRAAGSAEIEAALAASKEFGPTSEEARVLWDIVEEMNASDNSAAYKAPAVDEEYSTKVQALPQMLTRTKDEIESVRRLADELKGVKLAPPPSAAAATGGVVDRDDAMRDALAAARDATAEHGATSAEAKLAWEAVEEIAASATDGEASRPTLDEECLIELIEGCEALEKFKETLEALEVAE